MPILADGSGLLPLGEKRQYLVRRCRVPDVLHAEVPEQFKQAAFVFLCPSIRARHHHQDDAEETERCGRNGIKGHVEVRKGWCRSQAAPLRGVGRATIIEALPTQRNGVGMADLLGSGRLQLGQDFHGVPCMFDRYEEMVVVRAGDDIATDACLA